MVRLPLWVLGPLGPTVAFAFIAVSILQSPWFAWETNALSDLGHATDSAAAPLFNAGLFLGGFLAAAYALLDLRAKRPWTAGVLLLAGLALQSIAVFDEVYGPLHFVVSVAFFLLFWVAIGVYAAEARSLLSVVLFVAFMLAWALFWTDVYGGGIAIPEALSSAAGVAWLLYVVEREDVAGGPRGTGLVSPEG